MTIAKYEELTGKTIPQSQVTLYEAYIKRATSNLELLLGYTLDEIKVGNNKYVESGKAENCFCTIPTNLLPADPVNYAYRIYNYNIYDKYLIIDPAIEVYQVKLIFKNITVKTFQAEEFNIVNKNGRLMIEFCENCLSYKNFRDCCRKDCVQIAVDAEWEWQDEDDIPLDLQYLLIDMVDYLADPKKDVKSETLATHSYTKNASTIPEFKEENKAILDYFVGANGTYYRRIV